MSPNSISDVLRRIGICAKLGRFRKTADRNPPHPANKNNIKLDMNLF